MLHTACVPCKSQQFCLLLRQGAFPGQGNQQGRRCHRDLSPEIEACMCFNPFAWFSDSLYFDVVTKRMPPISCGRSMFFCCARGLSQGLQYESPFYQLEQRRTRWYL